MKGQCEDSIARPILTTSCSVQLGAATLSPLALGALSMSDIVEQCIVQFVVELRWYARSVADREVNEKFCVGSMMDVGFGKLLIYVGQRVAPMEAFGFTATLREETVSVW